MRRRSILLATALAPLAGCAALTPQTVVADAQLIATKLASFIPLLNAIPGIPAADTALVTQLSGYISQAAALAGIRDRHTIRARFRQLEAAGYLAKVGPAGCPPRYLYYWP